VLLGIVGAYWLLPLIKHGYLALDLINLPTPFPPRLR